MSGRVELGGDGEIAVTFAFDFATKEFVKALPGARFDWVSKSWRFEQSRAAAVVAALEPRGFAIAGAIRALSGDGAPSPHALAPVATPLDPNSVAAQSTQPESRGLTVRALNDRVAQVLVGAFTQPVWVWGEMGGFDRNAHRAYVWFDLLERDVQGGAAATLNCYVNAAVRGRLELALRNYNLTLTDGLRVLLRGRPELNAKTGRFQFVVDDIDAAFSVGDLIARREQILRVLREEAIAERNRDIALPVLPLRVALLTSANSDAYHDVVSVLRASGYAFDVAVFDVRVQGEDLERTVLAALAKVARAASRFDVCVVTRGGGSRVDLGWFDNLAVARAVALLPVKVVAAIGHQQDRSVLDDIALSRRTPTDAARMLVEHVQDAESNVEWLVERVQRVAAERTRQANEHLRRMGGELKAASVERMAAERARVDSVFPERLRGRADARVRVEQQRAARATARLSPSHLVRLVRVEQSRVERARVEMGRVANRRMQRAVDRLDRAEQSVHRTAPARVADAQRTLDELSMRTRLLDPARVLERGFAVLRTADGRFVTRAAQLAADQGVVARMADGTAEMVVTRVLPTEEHGD